MINRPRIRLKKIERSNIGSGELPNWAVTFSISTAGTLDVITTVHVVGGENGEINDVAAQGWQQLQRVSSIIAATAARTNPSIGAPAEAEGIRETQEERLEKARLADRLRYAQRAGASD